MIMPGPQASHSRDPPHFRSGNTRTRHNPEPGMLTEIVKAYLPRFGQFEQAIENAVPEMVAI